MSLSLPIALLASALLLATISWEAGGFTGPVPGEAAVRPPVPALVLDAPEPDTAGVAEGWVGTALERPLFRENRRPAKASSDPAKIDEPMRLTGVMTGPFGNRAIFSSANSVKSVVAEGGAHVGDFVIVSIEPGRVVVESGGDLRTLRPVFTQEEFPMRP
jgi:hypothetical protein